MPQSAAETRTALHTSPFTQLLGRFGSHRNPVRVSAATRTAAQHYGSQKAEEMAVAAVTGMRIALAPNVPQIIPLITIRVIRGEATLMGHKSGYIRTNRLTDTDTDTQTHRLGREGARTARLNKGQ